MLRQNTLLGLSVSLFLCAACADSTTLLPVFDGGSSDSALPDVALGRDVGPGNDAGVDASRPQDGGGALDVGVDAPPIIVSCDPRPAGDCGDVTRMQWFWTGGDCSPRRDCIHTGYASLGECRVAHAECGAPDICSGLPSFADSCFGVEGFAWDGVACVPGCDYLATEAIIYSTEQECTHFHAECSDDIVSQCGQVLPLGCSTIRTPSTHQLLTFSDHEACNGHEGAYDHQVVFVAPDEGAYDVRVQTEAPGRSIGAFVAATRGVCSARNPDVSATTACVEYDQPMRLPARALGVDSANERAHTIRISPSADPDEYTSLVVCIERAE